MFLDFHLCESAYSAWRRTWQILKVRRIKESRIASTNLKCVIGKVAKALVYRKIAVYKGFILLFCL